MQPVPAGIPADLWIGGSGVGAGYISRADLNEASFRDIELNGRSQTLYRSGDRAVWRYDGVLEYIGRDDDQIKLRGFRIEPGEIERTLRTLSGVRDAAVVLRGADVKAPPGGIRRGNG